MSDETLERLRGLCLTFPEAREQNEGSVGNPAFKVRDKIFALRSTRDGRISIWCKAPPGIMGMLVGSAPKQFFMPPYVGRYGWVGIWLDGDTDWDLLSDLIRDSYILTAPKRLSARVV